MQVLGALRRNSCCNCRRNGCKNAAVSTIVIVFLIHARGDAELMFSSPSIKIFNGKIAVLQQVWTCL